MTAKPVRVQQINQSIDWFAQALRQLLQTTDYSKITVSALATRSGLSRRTFYRHFESIDDLLRLIVDHQITECLSQIKTVQPKKFRDVIRLFFSYYTRHKSFLLALQKNDLMPLMLTELTRKTSQSQLATMFPTKEPFIYAFAAGGVWNLLNLWLTTGATTSPEEMARLSEKIAQHLSQVM
ncbi:TetR/AcrR family transcriptional regulator [Levilactobacillus acidifarinae]|uniref:HTH tetR-type domain-containing protein n=1 Tax=Levilactobacillus acidifarinae DSM 19394 = JCM 15949 TaxID=1423715 RepID=A0A0R1LK19_9LACO|nr:TetR/AcrR family transcriptional regulator [Levilactobacillus acidifarinae]KRK95912.1 hypothetical protein FD25_GL002372 [Levilactobacillus acidifarinae DSM 19394]GEO69213.1 TetR family transcriptional regulator [Levilactobacillus acidifarinae]